MNYQPKVVRCRLHTGGKTIQEIRERYTGQGMTYRDFEDIQRADEAFDGLVVLLSLWAYDNHDSYHLHNWDPTDDERMMMGIYYSEQVHPYPRYKKDLEKFKTDWAAGTYRPAGPMLPTGGRGRTGSVVRRDRAAGMDRPAGAARTRTEEAPEAAKKVRRRE